MNPSDLFEACQKRFAGDGDLVRLARRLYRETPNREQPNYVQFIARSQSVGTTFGGEFAEFEAEFKVTTKNEHPDKCDRILSRLRAVYDFTRLPGARFDVGAFDPISETAPTVEDATWTGSILYFVILNPKVVIPPTSNPETVNLDPVKDLRLESGAQAGSNRNSLLLNVGRQSGIIHRSILHFDLTAYLGRTVNACQLNLKATLENNTTWPCRVRRMTTTTWGETTATYNTSDGSTAWSPANNHSPQTGPYTTDLQVSVDLPDGTLLGNRNAFSITGLAALAQDAINNRSGHLHIMLMADDETVIFAHRPQFIDGEDATVADRPVLVLDLA